jgi:hypothetical protein
MFLNNVQIDAQNLDNAKDNPEELPSRLFLQAGSIGNGQLSMIIRMNVLKPTPDLDLDLKFENMNLQAIQHFFQEYAHANVEKGMFNLYSEVAVLNGRITGYVKPVFNNIKVLRNTTLQEEPVVVWGSVASNLTKVSGNAYKNRFISQVPMEGEMGNEQTTFWPALWNIFRNTFAQAFETKSTYAFAQDTDKLAENKKETVQPQKDKKDIRKEKRRERREKRKEKKREKKELEINKADKRTAKDNSLPL